MSLRGRLIGSGILLMSSAAATHTLRFVRNVILARLLTPSDFGISATFWITAGFLATITQLGFEQMLIRDKDGDNEDVGATGQTLLVLRGVSIGAVICIFARPMMSLFGSPEAAGAFRLIGISCVLGGFIHRDTSRMQRHMRFGPSVISQLGPDLVVTLAAWPIAAWRRDYTAFVVFALMQSVLAVVASRLVAERPFRLAWDRAVVRKYLSFGWPLLLNSLLMFLVMQGDRMVLAHAYTKAELGLYSVAVGLAMTPGGMLIGLGSQLMLPILAKAQGDRARFDRYYLLYVTGFGAIAAAMGILFILAGPGLIRLIYGDKYYTAGTVIGWLGAIQCVRLLRATPITAALALGDSMNSLLSNIARQAGLGLAVLAAVWGMPLTWIAATGVVGEVLAVGVSVARSRLTHQLPLWPLLRTSILVIAGYVLAVLVRLAWGTSGWFVSTAWSLLLVTVISLGIVCSCDYWREEMCRVGQLVKRKLGMNVEAVPR